jgi:hypothetical protein
MYANELYREKAVGKAKDCCVLFVCDLEFKFRCFISLSLVLHVVNKRVIMHSLFSAAPGQSVR